MLYAHEIGPDEKEEYLNCLREGMRPNQAAEECGSTGHQFRKFRRERTQYYDPEFAAAYAEAIKAGRSETEELVRDMIWDSAAAGNWSARWALARTWLPEFEWTKHANLNMNVQMQVLSRALPALTMEELERLQEAMADGRPPDLKALPEVIEAA